MSDVINDALKQFGGGTGISFRKSVSGWICAISSLNGIDVIGRDNEPSQALDEAIQKYKEETCQKENP